MANSSAVRTEVLGRIRRAIGAPADKAAIEAEWSAISRGYRRTSRMERAALLHLLEDRLRDYDAGVYRTDAAGLRGVVGGVLSERGKRRIAIPAGLSADWLPEGVAFVEDAGVDIGTIDGCDGVLTGATLAIAETGTIVLQNAPGQGRRALTLLPDYHLCVVDAASVVQTVPEAMALLEVTAHKATTFFSGPSATADIEMTRIKGVHGPRFVDVILLVQEPVSRA